MREGDFVFLLRENQVGVIINTYGRTIYDIKISTDLYMTRHVSQIKPIPEELKNEPIEVIKLYLAL